MESRVFIPSRRRSRNVARMQWFFPDAIWWVHEREAEDYLRAGVEPDRLWNHAVERENVITVHNALLDRVQRETELRQIVQVDDDIQEVRSLVSGRGLGPGEVQDAVDNLARMVRDLGLAGGTLSQDKNYLRYGIEANLHFKWIGILCAVHVINEHGLGMRFNEAAGIATDADWSLRLLMTDRVSIHDHRFLVSTEAMYTAPGGNTGMLSVAERDAGIDMMVKTWGGAVKAGKGLGLAPMMHGGNLRRRNPKAPRL